MKGRRTDHKRNIRPYRDAFTTLSISQNGDTNDTRPRRCPAAPHAFPHRALQVDSGSEFAAEFEQACHQRGLRLFVLPPRSPKLNGAVERANRTHTEEFYQVTACSSEMKKLNRELRHWEKIYNTVRPHQSLGCLTPQQFLLRAPSQRKE